MKVKYEVWDRRGEYDGKELPYAGKITIIISSPFPSGYIFTEDEKLDWDGAKDWWKVQGQYDEVISALERKLAEISQFLKDWEANFPHESIDKTLEWTGEEFIPEKEEKEEEE